MLKFGKAALMIGGLALGACTMGYTPKPIALPEVEAVAPIGVPGDLRLVAAAVTMRLRGASPQDLERQLLVRGGETLPAPASPIDASFSVRQVKIEEYKPDGSDPSLRTVRGLLHFEDPFGRRAAAAFTAEYRRASRGVTLQKSAWRPLYPELPGIETFVVPAGSLPANWTARATSYGALYALAAGKAVGNGRPAPAGPQHYYVFAFVKDRLGPDATFRVSVSADRFTTIGFEQNSRYRDFDGWPVGVVVGRFALDDADPFYIKAVYKPGKDRSEAERAERLIGLYSTASAR